MNTQKEVSCHSVVIVDDHSLFASSLEKLVNTFQGYKVTFIAKNGVDFKTKLLESEMIPTIVLLDINMPVMNGFETAEWITKNYPEINVIALSMDDDEVAILKILRKGAKGFLLKDINPSDLNEALDHVIEKGYYHSERVSKTLVKSLNTEGDDPESIREKLITFIKLCCTEMSYKEIAEAMSLSPKTIENYRQEVFDKLGIKNRVGIVLYAIKNKIFIP